MATPAISIDAVAAWIRERAECIPEVHTVYTELGNGILSVWFFVSRSEQDVRDRLYDLKEALYSEFPKLYFDIHILSAKMPSEGQELVSDASVTYRRKTA